MKFANHLKNCVLTELLSSFKEFFSNYSLHQSDVTFNLQDNSVEVHKDDAVEPWNITLVDTGDNSMTGGRLGRVAEYVKNEEAFCFTYGDGLSDVNIGDTIKFHQNHKKYATITAVNHPNRFGLLNMIKNEFLQIPPLYNQKFLMFIVENPQEYLEKVSNPIKRNAMKMNYKTS